MLLKDLLCGAKVRATKDCGSVIKGEVYEVKGDERTGEPYIAGKVVGRCNCIATWELISTAVPIHFDPPAHEHKYNLCNCGKEKN